MGGGGEEQERDDKTKPSTYLDSFSSSASTRAISSSADGFEGPAAPAPPLCCCFLSLSARCSLTLGGGGAQPMQNGAFIVTVLESTKHLRLNSEQLDHKSDILLEVHTGIYYLSIIIHISLSLLNTYLSLCLSAFSLARTSISSVSGAGTMALRQSH